MNAPNFVQRALPAGYTQVEYIQSSGTQYINTGFTPNSNSRVVMDAQLYPAPSGSGFLFGARTGSLSNSFTFLWYATPSSFRSDYGTKEHNIGTSVAATDRLKIDHNKNVITVNGATHTHTAQSFTAPVNLFLFCTNSNGTAATPASMRLYSCQIYDNETLVRDLVPAIDSGGTVGMYDMVYGAFYTNAGTGAFTAGPTLEYAGREARKWYLGAGTVMMTNLVPEGSFETMTKWSTWGTSSPDATQAQHGSYSLNLDTAGKFASVAITTPVVGHKYYAREYIKSSGEINPSDCRFEIHGGDGVGLNWVIGWNQGNYPDWTIKSGIVTIDAVNASSYVLRTFALDSTATVWLDNIVLVDLTEAFGAGNEPDLAWCDAHIPYFDGTQPVLCETAPAAARQIKKAYIGDANGVARMFLGGLDVAKMTIGYTGAYTDQIEVTMSGKKYRLLTLTGSGTLTFDSECTVDVWLCSGGSGGGSGYGSGYTFGGAGGYVAEADKVKVSGSVVCTVGAGSAGMIGLTAVSASGSTSFGSICSAEGVAGQNGGSGGGGGPDAGTGAGKSTVPFLDTSVFEPHSAGGGGGGHRDREDSIEYSGGAGGSNGSNGNRRTSSNYSGGAGGNKGGGAGGQAGSSTSNTFGEAATFYGSGGGGGAVYWSKDGEKNYDWGGDGYQGVIYVRIPYEQ